MLEFDLRMYTMMMKVFLHASESPLEKMFEFQSHDHIFPPWANPVTSSTNDFTKYMQFSSIKPPAYGAKQPFINGIHSPSIQCHNSIFCCWNKIIIGKGGCIYDAYRKRSSQELRRTFKSQLTRWDSGCLVCRVGREWDSPVLCELLSLSGFSLAGGQGTFQLLAGWEPHRQFKGWESITEMPTS